MKVVRKTCLWLALLVAFWVSGCNLGTGRPIEQGDGDGHKWAPDTDGKFLVISVDNQFTSDIEFVAHGRLGIFKMFVDKGTQRYMVLKDAQYQTELRTRTADAGKAEFMELEERVLGVRRIHLRAVVKGSATAPKTK